MKIIMYIVFAAVVLVSAIFILKPWSEKPEIAETPKETVQAPVSEASSPPDTRSEKQPFGLTPDSKPAHTAAKQGELKAPEMKELTETNGHFPSKQEDFLQAPGSPFDASQVPTFPPLPSLEDDDFPPFGELPTKGFGDDDWAEDDFGSDAGFFPKGEGGEQLDSGELR